MKKSLLLYVIGISAGSSVLYILLTPPSDWRPLKVGMPIDDAVVILGEFNYFPETSLRYDYKYRQCGPMKWIVGVSSSEGRLDGVERALYLDWPVERRIFGYIDEDAEQD